MKYVFGSPFVVLLEVQNQSIGIGITKYVAVVISVVGTAIYGFWCAWVKLFQTKICPVLMVESFLGDLM